MDERMASRRSTGRRRFGALAAIAAVLAGLLAMVPGLVPAGAETGDDGTVTKQGTLGDGYFFVATDGGIFNYGDSEFKGSTGDIRLNQPIVGAETTPTGEGYWLVASDGGIFTFGDAEFFGSTGDIKLNKPIVAMVATPTGQGYWLFATDGGVFTFGDAKFFGSTGNITLNQPIVGADATPTGLGYYLVASDGGIFNFGATPDDAPFFGSAGNIKLNKPIVGMAALDDGEGYYLVATDGGIFSYGRTTDDAQFYGSTGNLTLNQPIVGMDLTASNQGYHLVAADGGIFSFGDAVFLGSTGNIKLNKPIVGMRVTPNSPVEAPDFIVDLRGSKEVPGPGDPDGDGFALLDFTDDELCSNLKVNSIDQASAAHIHEAPAGQAGPVVITLPTPDVNGTSTSCQAVDPALVKEILANPQNYYVNVHNAAFPAGAVRGQVAGELGVAVTSEGKVVFFDTEYPEFTQELFTLSGLPAGAQVLGADFRPATGEAYLLVGVPGAPGFGQIVKADPNTGAGTAVGAGFAINGTSFGFDFNPVVDRIRIVSDAGQNLRVHPDTGAIAATDTPLAYAATDANSGATPNVVGAAYTNNRTPAPATTLLYDIDSDLDVLVTQDPPNAGTLNTVGSLGVDLSDVVSFDIARSTEAEPNAGAFVVARPAGGTSVAEAYAINPATGRAANLGTIGDGTDTIVAFSLL